MSAFFDSNIYIELPQKLQMPLRDASLVSTRGGFPEDEKIVGQKLEDVIIERMTSYIDSIRRDLKIPLPQPLDVIVQELESLEAGGYHPKNESQLLGHQNEFLHFNPSMYGLTGLTHDAIIPGLNFLGAHEIAHAINASLDLKPSGDAVKAAWAIHGKEFSDLYPNRTQGIMTVQKLNGAIYETFTDGLAINLALNFGVPNDPNLEPAERVERVVAGYVLSFYGVPNAIAKVSPMRTNDELSASFNLMRAIVVGEHLVEECRNQTEKATFRRLDRLLANLVQSLTKGNRNLTDIENVAFSALKEAMLFGRNLDLKTLREQFQ